MKDQSEVRVSAVNASTNLAADRTRLAYDRTLLAWIRTATSLITFGFTVYKFFQLELARVAPTPERLFGPRQFALLMILIGLLSLLMATLEHWRDLKELRAQYPMRNRPMATVLAALVSVLGLVAMAAVLFRQ